MLSTSVITKGQGEKHVSWKPTIMEIWSLISYAYQQAIDHAEYQLFYKANYSYDLWVTPMSSF